MVDAMGLNRLLHDCAVVLHENTPAPVGGGVWFGLVAFGFGNCGAALAKCAWAILVLCVRAAKGLPVALFQAKVFD